MEPSKGAHSKGRRTVRTCQFAMADLMTALSRVLRRM